MSDLFGIVIKNLVLGLRKYLRMTFINIRWKEDPNATHRDYLSTSIRELLRGGPINVVEVGSGVFSTLLLADLVSRAPGSTVTSFENNKEWFLRVGQVLDEEGLECDLRFAETYEKAIEAFLTERQTQIDLVFIDSSPWQSRVEALELLKDKANVVVIHDVDYFPHNSIFGRESQPIKHPLVRPSLTPYFNDSRLGRRNYDELFEYWVEIFPRVPSAPTGPPTLIASNLMDVREFFMGEGSPAGGLYLFSESSNK